MYLKGIDFKKCATAQDLCIIATIRTDVCPHSAVLTMQILKKYPKFNHPKFVTPITQVIGNIIRDIRRNMFKDSVEPKRPIGRSKSLHEERNAALQMEDESDADGLDGEHVVFDMCRYQFNENEF